MFLIIDAAVNLTILKIQFAKLINLELTMASPHLSDTLPKKHRHSTAHGLFGGLGLCAALSLFLTWSAHAQPVEAESFASALTTGAPELSFRLRSETMQDDGKPEQGNGLMLRSQLGWRSNTRHGLGVRVLLVSSNKLNSEFNDDS